VTSLTGSHPAHSVGGYLHARYAAALAECGTPRQLKCSAGWILISAVNGTSALDGRGCYPLFCCRDWPGLREDIDALGEDLVSLVLVTDPFGDFDPHDLGACFPHLFRPYKKHFVVDLRRPASTWPEKTHARYARKALQSVKVEYLADPLEFASDWVALYRNLIKRHTITGIARFSPDSLCKQLQVPGSIVFRAVHCDETVGMILYYAHGDTAYYHLAAYSDKGYALRASYALFAETLACLRSTVRWVNLGAGAGIAGNVEDGLSRFKRGWATGTRTAYICGRIFDLKRYRQLVRACSHTVAGFFPLYRSGEST